MIRDRTVCLAPQQTLDGGNGANDGTDAELWSVELQSTAYAAFPGFNLLTANHLYEVPCSVCMKSKTSGFTVWGSDTCPGRETLAYKGYIGGDNSQRNTHDCVEKGVDFTVARSMCMTDDGVSPLKACPANNGALTIFRFKDNWDDFVGSSEGTGGKWAWARTLGDHSGVIQRTHDSNAATLTTQCRLLSAKVEIRIDVLPRSEPSNL